MKNQDAADKLEETVKRGKLLYHLIDGLNFYTQSQHWNPSILIFAFHCITLCIKIGEKLLEEIQKALHDIGEAQLKMRCLHNEAMNMCTSDSAPSSSSAGSISAAASSQSHGPS